MKFQNLMILIWKRLLKSMANYKGAKVDRFYY